MARDQAEGVRLAYVAATRARDLLVVPALGDEAWEGGWLGPLNRALYPPMASRREPTRGPKCPAFKSKDSVLQRPNDETAGPVDGLPRASTRSSGGGYSVVWWDPSALSLGAKPPFGVRREELIVKDVPKHVVADGRGRYDRWQLARADARAAGSASHPLVVETAREWAGRLAAERPDARPRRGEPGSPGAIRSWRSARRRSSMAHVPRSDGPDRPRGAGFGSLVHAVLARVPFDAERSAIAALAALKRGYWAWKTMSRGGGVGRRARADRTMSSSARGRPTRAGLPPRNADHLRAA